MESNRARCKKWRAVEIQSGDARAERQRVRHSSAAHVFPVGLLKRHLVLCGSWITYLCTLHEFNMQIWVRVSSDFGLNKITELLLTGMILQFGQFN